MLETASLFFSSNALPANLIKMYTFFLLLSHFLFSRESGLFYILESSPINNAIKLFLKKNYQFFLSFGKSCEGKLFKINIEQNT